MAAAMLGSVVPDLDMVYFHFVDGGRTHHHAYVTHWPLFWAAVGGIRDIWPPSAPSLPPQ